MKKNSAQSSFRQNRRGKRESRDTETLDGSKYIGFMARDGGQWGSFSIHDDYGDEADAEGRDYDERFDAED